MKGDDDMSNVIEKAKPEKNTGQGSWQEEHIDNLVVENKETFLTRINKDFARTTKPVVFDKLRTQLITTAVADDNKNVDNYYNQIKSNDYVTVKGKYLVCRDLFDAKVNLSARDFTSLWETRLKYSYSTVLKYLAIGGDYRLFKMFNLGKLPTSWTTQYAITRFSDEEFARILADKDIHCESSLADIKKSAKLSTKSNENVEQALMNIGALKVEKQKVSKENFKKFENSLKKFMSDYKFITIEFANDFKTKIQNLVEKRDSKSKNSNTLYEKEATALQQSA